MIYRLAQKKERTTRMMASKSGRRKSVGILRNMEKRLDELDVLHFNEIGGQAEYGELALRIASAGLQRQATHEILGETLKFLTAHYGVLPSSEKLVLLENDLERGALRELISSLREH